MNEHAEDPVGQASSKVVQYVSLATMAAEAIAQVRQQRAAAAATTDARAAAALRAEYGAALERHARSGRRCSTGGCATRPASPTPGWRGPRRRPGWTPTPRPGSPASGPRSGCACFARTS